MPVVYPEGTPMEGNLKVTFIPALVAPAAPKLTEVNAVAGVELSSFIKEGTFKPAGEQAMFDDRRLSSTVTYQVPGRITKSIDDITYVYDPQAAPAAVGNAAYEKLPAGTQGYLIVRAGLPYDTDWAITVQKVDVWPVTMGYRTKQTPSGDAGEKFTVVQKVYVRGAVVDDVIIVT